MTDLPIACSLSADNQRVRLGELRTIGRRSLLSITRAERAPVALDFRSDAATKADLERIVAAEAQCCAFLDIRLRDGDRLRLTIDGPQDAAPIIDEMVGAFAEDGCAQLRDAP